ncbi:MAG: hypothetical protein HQL50_08520 [Magnetococcales bacterium]|nr:hypothetical protein [Magnetococcales bacterium]
MTARTDVDGRGGTAAMRYRKQKTLKSRRKVPKQPQKEPGLFSQIVIAIVIALVVGLVFKFFFARLLGMTR